MNRTQRAEEAELERVLYDEAHGEPRYPIIEKPEAAQLGKTALDIDFTQFDSMGAYIQFEGDE